MSNFIFHNQPIKLAVKTVPGNLPKATPLQPASKFVNPNLSGNVNYDADQQAARELQRINGQSGQSQQGTGQQAQGVPTNAAAELPTGNSNFLVIVIILAVLALLLGWLWFFRRVRHRKAQAAAEAKALTEGQ